MRGGRALGWAALTIAVAAVLFLGTASYLLVHALAETFSAVVAMAVFLLAWNARELLEEQPFLVNVGIVLLFVGLIDVVHALAYRGMGPFGAFFPGGDTVNLATQLWIVGRLLFAIGLPLSLLLPRGSVRPETMLASTGALAGVLLLLVFTGVFPDCFIPGSGLTPFKIGAEVVVSVLLALGGLILWWRRTDFDRRLVRLVGWAVALTIASELCFMLYEDPYALINSMGHILKIAAYVMLYRALVQLGLRDPYSSLFREVKRSEKALAESNQMLECRVAERTAELEKRQEQLRLLARELTQVERHERRRLATALHDDLAQLLVAAKLALSTADGDASPHWSEERQRINAVLDEAICVARDLIGELTPPRLDRGGLVDAVRALSERMGDHYGVAVDVETEAGLPELPLEERETMFNAVRELLVNAARHSGAPRARVTFSCDADARLRVVVEDHGSGFDPESTPDMPGERGGFGLFNLREQVAHLGGELRLISVLGVGTSAEVVLPLRQPTSAG
jgi:signal transduction histidine kinase